MLVFLFGAYVLVDGVALLVALARGDAEARRNAWAVGIMGVLGIVVGVVTFVWPGLTALSLLYLVAFWAIATGAFQVIAAIALRRELEGEFWMALGGVASIVFGALLIASPGDGLISLVWLVGIWSVVFGVSSLGLAYRLHDGRRGHARVCRVALTRSGRDRPRGLHAADDRVDRHEQRWERRQRRSHRCVSSAEPTEIREGEDAR